MNASLADLDDLVDLDFAWVERGRAQMRATGACEIPNFVRPEALATFVADARRLDAVVGASAVHVSVESPRPWPHRRFGGSSLFQSVPGLNQYWHPWLLGGTARGHAVVD